MNENSLLLWEVQLMNPISNLLLISAFSLKTVHKVQTTN